MRSWAECPCHEYQIRSPTCAGSPALPAGVNLQQSAWTHNRFADASKSYPGSGCSNAHSTHCVLLEGLRQLFGGWLAVPLEQIFLPLSNSAIHRQAAPNQQQYGLPKCQGDCKGAGAGAVWGKTSLCLGELQGREQGENLLKPMLYRKQGVSSVQHPLHSRTVTFPEADPLGAVSVGAASLMVHSEHLLQVCTLCPHLRCTCSHGCNFLGRGELASVVSARKVQQQQRGRGAHVGQCHMCEHQAQAWHKPGNGVHSFVERDRDPAATRSTAEHEDLSEMDGVTVGR